MTYICQFRGCELFESCPVGHRLTATPESYSDEDTGESLFDAICDEVDHIETGIPEAALTEEPKIKDVRENASPISVDRDKRIAVLLKQLNRKLKDTPNSDAASVLASYETADAAITLHDAQREVLAIRKSHLNSLGFCTLLLDVIDTYFAVLDAAEFYAGARQIDIHDTPALRMTSKGGFIDILDSDKKLPANLIRGYLASGLDNNLISIAFGSLDTLLRSLCKTNEEEPPIRWDEFGGFFYQFANTATNEEMFGPKPAPDIDDFMEMLGKISLLFKNLQTALRLLEHEIYDQHPEWEVTYHTGGPTGDFKAEKDRQNQSAAFHDYYEKFGNPLGRFETVTSYLNGGQSETSAIPAGSDPRPFLTPASSNQLWDYSAELELLLMTPVCFSYESPVNAITSYYHESTVEGSLNPWLADAKLNTCTALVSYCRSRAKCLLPGGKANDLWMRAIAELLSSRRDSEQVITLTQGQAKAFMAAANEAAKEEWIERRKGGAAEENESNAIAEALDKKLQPRFEQLSNEHRQQTELLTVTKEKVEAVDAKAVSIKRKLTDGFANLSRHNLKWIGIFAKVFKYKKIPTEEVRNAIEDRYASVNWDRIKGEGCRQQIRDVIDYTYDVQPIIRKVSEKHLKEGLRVKGINLKQACRETELRHKDEWAKLKGKYEDVDKLYDTCHSLMNSKKSKNPFKMG